MDLYENSTKVNLEDLPLFLYKEVKPIYDDVYCIDEEEEESTVKRIKYVKYPQDVPLAFADFLFDGGMEITSTVRKTINLTCTNYISCFANGVSFYEKEEKNKPSYVIFQYGDGDYHRGLVVIEIN